MVFIRNVVLVSLMLFSWVLNAQQTNRYMVFFKDKQGTPYSISNPGAFLSQKAIERRVKQDIKITELDLPVNPSYVAGVRETGVEAYYRSKWFNGVLIQCDTSLISSVGLLPFVERVELVAPEQRLQQRVSGRTKFNLRIGNTKQGSATRNQLTLIGLNYMLERGYHGETVTIAVLDSGFPGVDTIDAFEHLFTDGRINTNVSFNFVRNSANVFQKSSAVGYDHGTKVFSVIAGVVPNVFTGGAYGANFVLFITEDVDTEFKIEEYNWDFAAERADSAGVDIIGTSLGYSTFDAVAMDYKTSQMDGKTAVSTRAAQYAANRGMVVVASAGNEGTNSWQIITAPSDAEDVLAVANVTSSGAWSQSSSIGPSADHRIKPDVAAMGTAVKAIGSDGKLTSLSGTSLASPLITSLAAGVWQRYPELTNKEVIDAIRHSASQSARPDNYLGYGIPNFKAIENYRFDQQYPQADIFNVYPNPVIDTLILYPKNPDAFQNVSIDMLTSDGKPIGKDTAQFTWLNRSYRANVSTLSSGLYFVRVMYEGRRYIFRVFKE
jgi:serine protease AprX